MSRGRVLAATQWVNQCILLTFKLEMRPATPYLTILLCLMPDHFMRRGESAAATRWVNETHIVSAATHWVNETHITDVI